MSLKPEILYQKIKYKEHPDHSACFVDVIDNKNSITERFYLKNDRNIDEDIKNMNLHRIGGPAYIKEDSTRQRYKIVKEEYYKDGKLHNTIGPARIINHTDDIHETSWFYNGKRHRKGAAAYVLFDHNKNMIKEVHYVKGEMVGNVVFEKIHQDTSGYPLNG